MPDVCVVVASGISDPGEATGNGRRAFVFESNVLLQREKGSFVRRGGLPAWRVWAAHRCLSLEPEQALGGDGDEDGLEQMVGNIVDVFEDW